jgi:hypothetical protein
MTIPSLLNDLLSRAAGVLANTKAYDLPSVCTRYGLSGGSGDEAYKSKFTYARRRLVVLSSPELLRVAGEILIDFPDSDLEEALALATEISGPRISELTRRKIVEALDDVDLKGQIGHFELLEPLFPLDTIPSIHHSGRTIRYDIERHCIANDDISNSDLLKGLGVLTCSQKRLFGLLARLVDPVVRHEAEQPVLVERINKFLKRDGFALQPAKVISGYQTFSVRALSGSSTPADKDISERLERFDEAGIHALWQKALARRASDPEGAITIARTFLERTCKHILDELSVEYAEDSDLSKLWALCAEQLNLAPSQHTEDVFRRILGNCQSVVNYLGTIRNRLGDSHSPRGKPVKPKPRHAELVVNLAGAMATFLVATWSERQSDTIREAS